MKIRQGFISNSSSSSFIVDINDLTCKQRAYLNKLDSSETWWQIIDNYPVIFGHCIMDNFDLIGHLKNLDFPINKFHIYHSNTNYKDSVYRESQKTCDCDSCKLWRDV